jgi:predicted DCC family thiol-disulfide oxidoreductase YuxK
MERPVMIYDGECAFCCRWMARWRRLTRDAVESVPSQDPSVKVRFAFVPPELYARTVVLVVNDGRYLTGAEAVVESLAGVPVWRRLVQVYRRVPAAARLMEAGYRFVARHRCGWT